MYNNEKIGVGIVTCNRPQFFIKCFKSLKDAELDELIVVNDGGDFDDWQKLNKIKKVHYIHNSKNIGVGASKNKILTHLTEKKCDYIFLIEDDIEIKNPDVFKVYIDAYKKTGIEHLNYGPGTPFNRRQNTNFDIHNRHLLENNSSPNPKLTVQYKDVSVSFYEHIAGLFSFFTKNALDNVGLFDEQFYNAWDHVDHTYRIIQKELHPPFWWFADISDSEKYLSVQQEAITKSSIAKSKDWYKNIYDGREKYLKKHGIYPNAAPQKSQEEVVRFLKKIKK